jgi:SAM-dependent methyltransferase
VKLYGELAGWWPLLSAPAEYAAEADYYWSVILAQARRPVQSLLELGCGGGNNAARLKRRAALTLTDLSPPMLAISRRLNPECEHVAGDMRALRLGRVFDAVLTHDAVMYLTTLDELRQAIATAYAHCAPGGVALWVPDAVRETWAEDASAGGHDGPERRALRYFQWTWDPDPSDTEVVMDMVMLLRTGADLRVEHERHRHGLFGTETWLRSIEQAGFEADVVSCPYPGGENARCFIGRRP